MKDLPERTNSSWTQLKMVLTTRFLYYILINWQQIFDTFPNSESVCCGKPNAWFIHVSVHLFLHIESILTESLNEAKRVNTYLNKIKVYHSFLEALILLAVWARFSDACFYPCSHFRFIYPLSVPVMYRFVASLSIT